MLTQNYLPGCIEASSATRFSSDITKQDSCDSVSGVISLEMSKNEKCPLGGCGNLNSKDGDACSLNSVDGPGPSNFSTMTGNPKPVVYHRRRFRRNPCATLFVETSAEVRPNNACPSELCSEVRSGTFNEDLVAGVAVEKLAPVAPIQLSAECDGGNLLSKSNSCEASPEGLEQCYELASRNAVQRITDSCVNDSCSSSKFNLEFGSSLLKNDVDDAGECSTSGALVLEGLDDNMPEKDICVAILRRYGLLETVVTSELLKSTGASDKTSDNCRIISCKGCNCSEISSTMLICDNCDDAYHLSCCNPRVRKIPEDQWFCQSCSTKKKRKLLAKSTCKPLTECIETENYNHLLSEGESGPIALMLADTEMYRTCVRIGKNFQAEVPAWTGPLIDQVDDRSGEASELRPSDYLGLHECSSNKTTRSSYIGNWVQCQQVIQGAGECMDGRICGKWRRAPLFEVQTDEWECFRAVLWDPAHADCAVPQELETEEVLKQLKYIEPLRPRLVAKRRKLDQKSGSASRCSTEK